MSKNAPALGYIVVGDDGPLCLSRYERNRFGLVLCSLGSRSPATVFASRLVARNAIRRTKRYSIAEGLNWDLGGWSIVRLERARAV